MRLDGMGLRARLSFGAVLGGAITLAILIATFNLVLDARLRIDADNVLRERAATVLRALGTVDGRLTAIEAPDQGVVDAQTWVFAGERAIEKPAGADSRSDRVAKQLAQDRSAFRTVTASDTRLYAVPVRQGGRRLGTVVVGASLAPYESTASSALFGSAFLGVLMIAAIGIFSRWLVGRALRPVARLTEQAADWSEHDLSRRFFTGRPHDELSTLASVFDGLLARLAQSLRHEQRLTAEVSHELRTPLAKILAESELATSRDRSSREYRASLQLVRRYAQDLQRVLETLLASARATGSGGPATSDARAAAESAAALMHEELAAQGREIAVVCSHPAMVAVEAEVVERILSPVLENAVRYARDQITLTIRAADRDVIFEIRDDGRGVDDPDRERIFDPGFRSTERQSDEHLGAGLGLPLARRLARAAGGDVEASGSSPGGEFLVRLPRRLTSSVPGAVNSLT